MAAKPTGAAARATVGDSWADAASAVPPIVRAVAAATAATRTVRDRFVDVDILPPGASVAAHRTGGRHAATAVSRAPGDVFTLAPMAACGRDRPQHHHRG